MVKLHRGVTSLNWREHESLRYTTTPSMQFHMDLEAMESELIQESTQASDDGALLHLDEQATTPIAQAMLGAMVVECIPISATVCNGRSMQQRVCDILRRHDGRGTAGTS